MAKVFGRKDDQRERPLMYQGMSDHFSVRMTTSRFRTSRSASTSRASSA